MTLVDGGTLDLAAQRGKVVVLNVWGSWCPPCRDEAPDFSAVATATQADGVEFVGRRHPRQRAAAAKAFLERQSGLTYPSVVRPGRARSLLRVRVTCGPPAIPSHDRRSTGRVGSRRGRRRGPAAAGPASPSSTDRWPRAGVSGVGDSFGRRRHRRPAAGRGRGRGAGRPGLLPLAVRPAAGARATCRTSTGLAGAEAPPRPPTSPRPVAGSPPGPGCAAGPCWARCCSCSASPSCSSRSACCSAGSGGLLIEHQRPLERVLGVARRSCSGWPSSAGCRGPAAGACGSTGCPSAGLAGAPLLGLVFGLGWTPCIGPTLGAVQSLALSTAGAGRGAAAVRRRTASGSGCRSSSSRSALRGAGRTLGVVRRHADVVTRVGGGLLVVLGLLLVTGLWGQT